MYIALDIETTGLSAERDEIIELGATLFDNDKILKKYQTFLKASEPLPPLITHITSITDADLEGAPNIEDVQEEFMDFIGDYPIVGHSIQFDLGFLRAKGIVFENITYDTLPLSQMLLPGLPTYSLEMITQKLEIDHKAKHRALDDAIASAILFQQLAKKISEIDHDILEEIKVLVKRSNWSLKDLFLTHKSSEHAKPTKRTPRIIADTETLKFDKEEILSMYKEDGPLSKCETDYEVREPQTEMTSKIIDAFKNSHHLLCEAGTGTGKSIAYLMASAFRSRYDNEKVVISTHTKNLQDQLFNKDIPKVQKAINLYLKKDENAPPPFSATVLKGRKNYLSGERLDKYKQKNSFQEHEITMLIKILLWLPRTQTGDKEELSLQGREYFAWNDVCCDGIKCPHNDARYNAKCFLSLARERANESDLIITNHALLLSDAMSNHAVLPEHNYLVVDEAHHIENEATKALTINLAVDIFDHPLNTIRDLVKKYSEVVDKIESLKDKISILFGLLGIFFQKNVEYANSIQNLMLNENFKAEFEWKKVTDSAENVVLQGRALLKELAEHEEDDDRIQQESSSMLELINALSFVVLEQQDEDNITWLYKKYDDTVGIKSTPVNVGTHLQDGLFSQKESIIMTSATLTVDSSFAYIRSQLALDEHFEECILHSHFSYPDQVEVVVYDNLKAPATPGYFDQSCEIIRKTAEENGGKMLVLFTAKKAIEATYLTLAPILKQQGITILGQNVSGGRGKIIELFKQDPDHSIIFGTNSFWEGVDIKGEALNCVIIQKLPFDPPDDPIHSRRSALYENQFNEYQIPRAILRFKQGFGRLIRSSRDSGKVIVMDSRVVTKSYGNLFLRSLPEGVRIERKSFGSN
ncbi:helicase C-terminal domain-containing protein [Patescibacteria group bacterium]